MKTQTIISKAQHTPGKWMIADCPIDMRLQAKMLTDHIGTKREWCAVGISDDEGFAEVIALAHPKNARLIAQAPELLKSLYAIEAALTQPVQYTGIRNGASCDVLRADCKFAVNEARAAIAQATGGQIE